MSLILPNISESFSATAISSPILTWWLKNRMSVEVTLDKIDHCAKNATTRMIKKLR